MEYINHNDMAESLIKSRANIPEYPRPFSVGITHEEVQQLKQHLRHGDPEKYFIFQGHVYKWWIYYNPTPFIGVAPNKEKEDNGQLDLDLASDKNPIKIARLIELANNLDELGEFCKSDKITERLANISSEGFDPAINKIIEEANIVVKNLLDKNVPMEIIKQRLPGAIKNILAMYFEQGAITLQDIAPTDHVGQFFLNLAGKVQPGQIDAVLFNRINKLGTAMINAKAREISDSILIQLGQIQDPLASLGYQSSESPESDNL